MFVDVSDGFVGDIGAEFKYNARLCEELKEKFSKEEGNFTPDDMMRYLKKTNLTIHIKTMLSFIPEGKEAEFKEAICSAAERRKLPPVNYRKMLEIAHKGGFAEEFERVHALDKVINDKPRKTKTLFVKSTEGLASTPNLSEYTGFVLDSDDVKMAISGNKVFVAKSNEDLRANPDLTKYDLVICDFRGDTEFADLTKLCKRMVIKGHIDWSRRDFDKLPDISESIVCGNFGCEYCENIKSLKGAPKYVGLNFRCGRCYNLTSLKGAPKYVGLDFDCISCNNLLSLKEAPEYVGGVFDCRGCKKLEERGVYLVQDGKYYDLFNLPKDREFVINGNLRLVRGWEELPDLSNVIVKGKFDCSYSDISDLKGSPKEVGKDFNCRGCKNLTSAEGLSMRIGGKIRCDDEFRPLVEEELKRREKEQQKLMVDEEPNRNEKEQQKTNKSSVVSGMFNSILRKIKGR